MSQSSEISRSKRFGQILSVLNKYHAFSGLNPVSVRMILEDLGPTYVKLGQILSSRQDLIPAEYAKELKKLRSGAEEMDFAQVREILESSLHAPLEEIFVSFEEKPTGAASMAQVHQAVLKDGRKVAVKVQRPNIAKEMEVDVQMMKKAGKLLSKSKAVSSLVDVEGVIDEFWQTTKQELDFRQEAQHMKRFAKESSQLPCVKIPQVIEPYVTENVLVMEYADGIEIDSYAKLADAGYDRHEIAMKLVSHWLYQVLDTGFFHADPHSGNLKVSDGQIVWLDFGMMANIDSATRKQLETLVQALASSDYGALTDAVLAIGKAPEDLDYPGLYNALEQFARQYGSLTFESLDLSAILLEAVEICRKYKIRLPYSITMLARSVLTMQGTLADLDPSVSVLEIAMQQQSGTQSIDASQLAFQAAGALASAVKAGLSIPSRMDNVLSQMQKGQLRLSLSLADLPHVVPELGRMTNRLVVAMLIAALLVGSSIVCTTQLKPMLLGIPALGLLGFLLSFVLSLWLFVKMLLHPKKGTKIF